jgi:hypothetical protein
VLAGDTLYEASRVVGKQAQNEQAGIVRFKLVNIRKQWPATLMVGRLDLFDGRFDQKVFAIEHGVLMPRRSATG